ncbi:MAG: SH3 domain-containing protein [Anaerolineae bacterium]|nr:SH3 domain-containing protein [Anaerolineae bacterium]
MGGESDNFLPPWLKGADEPDDDVDTRRETDRVEPAEGIDHAQPPSSGVTLPPWLADEEPEDEEAPISEALLRATKELSPDFFDSADALPDTVQSELSYDEWLQIQQEANRERSVDEEVPDLLSEDTAATSPFLEEAAAAPAATGELPNWFLGLEELDESQAPDWFLAQGTVDQPAVDETPPDSEAWELPPDLNDVAAMMPDLFGGSAEDAPAAGDATDTFLNEFNWQQPETSMNEAAGQSFEADQGFVSDWEPAAEPFPQALPDDDFYAAYASLGEDSAAANDAVPGAALSDHRQDSMEVSVPAELAGAPPPVDTASLNQELPADLARESDFDEPDLNAFANADTGRTSPDTTSPNAGGTAEIALDADSLSWLNEINSMVKSVTSHPEDTSGEKQASSDESGDRGEAGQDFFFADDSKSAAPDWLSELGPLDTDALPTASNTGNFARGVSPDSDSGDEEFDTSPIEDTYFDRQDNAVDPTRKAGTTAGATVILDLDPLPSANADLFDEQITSPPQETDPREQLASLVTDEIDPLSFGEEALASKETLASTETEFPDTNTDAATRLDDEYLILERLASGATLKDQSESARADDDLAWLQHVSFDDLLPDEDESGNAAFHDSAPSEIDHTHAVPNDFSGVGVEPSRSPSTSAQMDDLGSLLDNLAAPGAAGDDPEAAFDALVADLEEEPLDVAQVISTPRYLVQTNELDLLFGESEVDEENTSTGLIEDISEDQAQSPSVVGTGSSVHNVREQQTAQPEQLMPQNDDFDAVFGGMNEPPEDGSESLPDDGLNAGADEDLDELFASLDASLEDQADLPPSTAMLFGQGDPQGQAQSDEAEEADLEALFAAFEDEHLGDASGQGAPVDASMDFADNDDFFAAMGLGDAPLPGESPPPDEAQSPPEDTTGPNLDFLEGFGQPEMSETTDISGEDNPSLWEAPEMTEELPQEDLPAVAAFTFDADSLPSDTESQDDWSFETPIDDFAPAPLEHGDLDFEMTAEDSAAEQVPGWLQEIDASALPSATDETASEAAAALFGDETPVGDLDSFLAGLDAPEAVLSRSNEFSGLRSGIDEFDLEAMFDQALPDTSTDETLPEPPGLEQSDILGELQASVGAVSAAALARQMKDRPETELSERLQKLRKRSTDEMRAVQIAPQGEEDNVSKVLPGVDDALVPVPVTIDPGEFFGGVNLSDQQRAQVALLGELVGSSDEPIQMQGTNRLSAIDLTYEGISLQDEDGAAGERAATMAEARRKRRVRRKRTYRIDRLLLSLLLAAGIIAPFFVRELRIGALPPTQFAFGSQERQAFDQIDKLQEYDLVMIGLEYGAASAGELDPLADALVRHVLLRGARPIFVSENTFGVLRAEHFVDGVNADRAFLQRINQRTPIEPNIEYYAARFLPGGAVGLRAFSEATSGLLTYDINGQTENLNLESLSNLALIVMVTDRAEDVRAYAEQIAPLASRPLVVGVSYAAAPLAEPYARNESVVRGLLVGYEDAYTYGNLLGAVDAVRRGARPIRPTIVAPAVEQPDSQGEVTGTPEPSAALTPENQQTPGAAPTSEPAGQPLLSAIVISADGANLRAGPGTDFRRVTGIARNTQVLVLGYNDTGDWVNIRLEDGTEGWVSSGLIVIVEETPVPDESTNGKRTFLQEPATQTEDSTLANREGEPDAQALQWYAMNTGLVGAFLVVSFGALTGILRAVFLRRKSS